MRIAQETDIGLLRAKAKILEQENNRLSKKLALLMRENLELKGMGPEEIQTNLPGLCSAVTDAAKADQLTRSGNERRKDAAERKQNKGKTEKKNKGHGPTEQPDLPRLGERHDLDEPDQVCPTCGGELKEWHGHDSVSEMIDVVERTWVVKEIHCTTYRCSCGHIETADGPTKLIPGGRYSPEVGITSAIDKYINHQPLNRQVSIAKSQNANLTSQTLWDQNVALALLLTPLYLRLKVFVLSHPVIGADESPFKLIKKGGSVKWQAWELSCPEAIFFSILSAKSAEVGKQLFEGFAGTLMVDGAPVYTAMAKELNFIVANCWSHARRRVLAASGEAPGQVQEFLDLVGKLYAIDRRAVRDPPAGDCSGGYRKSFDLAELKRLRDTESRQVIADLQAWILGQRCVPGGLLKKGLSYVARRWSALTLFLDNPLVPLDNNRTEGGYLGMALGRRNYIGARSVKGTEVAAKFYSICESAKLNGADPAAYLRYATYATLAGETPLLPHEWVAAGR